MSYQNVSESQITGYNDCPVLEFKREGSSAPKTRRKFVAHPLQAETSQPSTPLIRPKISSAPSLSSIKSNLSKTAVSLDRDVVISDSELLEKLENILKMESDLQEREFQHYRNRVLQYFTKGLGNDSYKKIVSELLDNYKDKDRINKELIAFMLKNDGTSAWCLPLRKILENVKIR